MICSIARADKLPGKHTLQQEKQRTSSVDASAVLTAMLKLSPGLRSTGSGNSTTKSFESGAVQLRCKMSGDTFLTVIVRACSCPAFHPNHLTSVQHSIPSLQEDSALCLLYGADSVARLYETGRLSNVAPNSFTMRCCFHERGPERSHSCTSL